MRLNKNKVYDLSELTSEEWELLKPVLNENSVRKFKYDTLEGNFRDGFRYIFFNTTSNWVFIHNDDAKSYSDITNAKELFYTLENVQVDCRELSEEQIKEMCKVYESNGIPVDYNDLNKTSDCYYLHKGINLCFVRSKGYDKHTITYSKFMDLFGENADVVSLDSPYIPMGIPTNYEVKYIAEQPSEDKPQHYSKGIDTFARMEANCTKEECLAFAKGNIDKYNFRTKGQDLEDYKKIVSYANWAIKLLKDEK